MKKGLKIWLWIFAIHFIINMIYILMETLFWWVSDDYFLILSPTTIFCAGGGCGMGSIIFLILISGLIISTILTGIILLFSRKTSP